jgi:hypothetical protein
MNFKKGKRRSSVRSPRPREVMMKFKDFMSGHGGNVHFVVRFQEF